MAFWKKFFQYFFKKPLKFHFFLKNISSLSYKEVKYKQSYVWGRTLKMTIRQWSSNCDAWINAHTLPIFRVFARWKVPNETVQNLPFSKQKKSNLFFPFFIFCDYISFPKCLAQSEWRLVAATTSVWKNFQKHWFLKAFEV